MRELLIATGNQGKFREIAEILRDADFQLVSLGDLKISTGSLKGDLKEDGKTFQENAYKKAAFFADKAGMLTLSEDSGILVNAFLNELGVQTRRWGVGESASDEEWVNYFLEKMKGMKDRGAKFVCHACLIDPEKNRTEYFSGETAGVITEKLMAEILPGLPLSSCFLPEGYEKVYAALSVAEKNEVSHRGKAIKKVAEWLKKS